jgi:hypothetical protein
MDHSKAPSHPNLTVEIFVDDNIFIINQLQFPLGPANPEDVLSEEYYFDSEAYEGELNLPEEHPGEEVSQHPGYAASADESSDSETEHSKDSTDSNNEWPVDPPIATFVQRSPCLHEPRGEVLYYMNIRQQGTDFTVPIYQPSPTRASGSDVADDLPTYSDYFWSDES